MKIEKWGDDLAVRLPAHVVEALDLEDGDKLEIVDTLPHTIEIVTADRVVRLRTSRGSLPSGVVFDRDEANAR